MSDEFEIIRSSDFHSFKLEIKVTNLTSRSAPIDPKLVVLDEIDGKTLVLGLPTHSCSRGHNVMIEITRLDGKPPEKPADPKKPAKAAKSDFQATGKVIGIAQAGKDEGLRATIDLVQYDEESWNNFLKLFADRQEEITDFLMAVKG